MLNLSSILKKYREDKKKRESGQTLPQEDIIPPKSSATEGKDLEIAQVRLASAVNKELEGEEVRQAKEIYDELFSRAKEIYRPGLEQEPHLLDGVKALIEKIADLLDRGNKGLLNLALSDYPNPKDYLYHHVVNVCIISIDIGLGLGYEHGRLVEFGSAAFLHDIGSVQYLDIINKPKILSNAEYDKIKEHPRAGIEILNKIGKALGRIIFEVVEQEHERIDGSGYPKALKGSGISEYAQIVGLVDVYEAMIHIRPYRPKVSPLETVKLILRTKEAFDCRIVKIMIERLGVFPVGIPVRLNTKEVGIVIRENQNLPLRPVLNIVIDASGKKLKEPREIDLSKKPMLYVEECLTCVK
jgi:HD-GYP domain-containing protein (c-di-GMP phosphodiesterase class II)